MDTLEKLDQFFPLHWRIVAVAAYFLVQGIRDWKTNPKNPLRAKEYLFLLGATSLAIVFGIVHDAITSRISQEYFIVGKGLNPGPEFNISVLKLAVKASYSPGLIIGMSYLALNNPSPTRPKVTYLTLFKLLSAPILGAILCAVLGFFVLWSSLHTDRSVSIAFVKVHSIHIGTYIGGALGWIVGMLLLRKQRNTWAA